MLLRTILSLSLSFSLSFSLLFHLLCFLLPTVIQQTVRLSIAKAAEGAYHLNMVLRCPLSYDLWLDLLRFLSLSMSFSPSLFLSPFVNSVSTHCQADKRGREEKETVKGLIVGGLTLSSAAFSLYETDREGLMRYGPETHPQRRE